MNEVKINIESVVEDLDDAGLVADSDKTKSEAVGTLTEGDNATVIAYSETEEGVTTSSEIIIGRDSITVNRTGGVEYSFLFAEGKTTSSLYKVPPYSFDTEIYTRRIRKEFAGSEGKVTLFYDMTIGGAKKKTRMTILIKNA